MTSFELLPLEFNCPCIFLGWSMPPPKKARCWLRHLLLVELAEAEVHETSPRKTMRVLLEDTEVALVLGEATYSC